MPPKKKAGSSQPARQTRSSSREPAPQPLLKTKSRKRRPSDESDASVATAQSALATPSKRRKRGAAETEHDILEQVPEVVEDEDELDDDAFDVIDSIDVSQSSQKHVHFGGAETDEEAFHPTATATPHPTKMTIKRRTTMSPHLNGSAQLQNKHRESISIRRSLSSFFSPLFSQESQELDEVQYNFNPLSEVLPKRIQQRARIQEELSQQSQLGDMVKDEVHDTSTQDMLVLDNTESVDNLRSSRSHLTSAIYKMFSKEDDTPSQDRETGRFSLSQSQRSQEVIVAEERNKYQNAILTLSKEAEEAKQRLRIFEIEVIGLGFGDEGQDTLAILASIREAFLSVRERLDTALSTPFPDDASNSEFLSMLADRTTEYAKTLELYTNDADEKQRLIDSLDQQVQGLVDRLADAKLAEQRLERQCLLAENSDANKSRELAALQEEIEQIDAEKSALEEELENKNVELQDLDRQKEEAIKSQDRLSAAVQSYREEEVRLTALVTKMEKEYEISMTKMNQERESVVRELETQLEEQSHLRSEAEQEGLERQATITNLELEVETLLKERSMLRNELADLTVDRDAELEARETAESDLKEKAEQVEDLEARVDALDEELNTVTAEIEELRQLNDSERQQREAAESEVDAQAAKIDEITQKLQEQGKAANELRQKLFEVQQLNERKVQELEVAASERDERYQEDIGIEVDRREAAEALAQRHADSIEDLEAQVEQVEGNMRASLRERDDLIAALKAMVDEKDAQIESLQATLKSAEDLYRAQVIESENQKEELDERAAEVQRLQHEALAIEERHASETEGRNARIAELNHDVAELRDQTETLEQAKQSLESRVAEEALQMLQLQNETGEEIESLKALILDKQEKIRIVEEKALEADRSWQEYTKAREEEISILRTTQGNSEEKIAVLTANLQSCRRMLAEYVRETTEKMAEREGDLAAQQVKLAQDRANREGEGERLLAEMDSMEGFQPAFMSSVTNSVQEVVTKKTTTKGRKKRVKDSGIGMSPDDHENVLLEL